MRWRRVRPGLYHYVGDSGRPYGMVERGAETGRWYSYLLGSQMAFRGRTLRDAKAPVEKALR